MNLGLPCFFFVTRVAPTIRFSCGGVEGVKVASKGVYPDVPDPAEKALRLVAMYSIGYFYFDNQIL